MGPDTADAACLSRRAYQRCVSHILTAPTVAHAPLDRRATAYAARRGYFSVCLPPCSSVISWATLPSVLGVAGERRQLHHRLELLPGDRLGVGELLETVGAVDATEARLPDPAERQAPAPPAKAITELTDVMPERIRRAIDMPLALENTAPARPYVVALVSSNGLVHARDRVDRERRAERLLGDLGGVLGHVGQDRRLDEPLTDRVGAAERHPGALGDRVVDVALDDPELRRHRDRPDLGARRRRRRAGPWPGRGSRS